MATASIATLHREIEHLEQELLRRRRALAILQPGKERAPAGPAARPAAVSSRPPVTTRTAIAKLFTAAPSLRLTSKQLRDRLAQRGMSVTPDTVQRQLRGLVKAKVVSVQNGQYRLTPKRPTTPKATAKPGPAPQTGKPPTAKATKA